MVFKSINFFSAERTSESQDSLSHYFYQHQKAYSFCLNYAKDKKVIEIGSGGGYGASRLAALAQKVIGIDKDLRAVTLSKKLYKAKNLTFIHADIKKYGKSETFDVITCLQFIEHMEDPTYLLSHMQALLSPKGIAIITTPNSVTQSFNENPYHFKEYADVELQKLLRPYFKKIVLFGLYGDKRIQEIDKKRKQSVQNIKKFDLLGLRRILPRKLRQMLFDSAASLMRKKLIEISDTYHYSEHNFNIKKSTNGCMDLIAVCYP